MAYHKLSRDGIDATFFKFKAIDCLVPGARFPSFVDRSRFLLNVPCRGLEASTLDSGIRCHQ